MKIRTQQSVRSNIYCYLITKGRKNQEVFLAEADYRYYLRLLKKYKRQFSVRIYGFCLLSKEVHLIVHLEDREVLSLFINAVNQSYSIYFNAKYQTQDPLWYKRFRSKIIARHENLGQYIEWVEFKPVKNRLANSIVEYPWSSCSYRVLGRSYSLIDTWLPSGTNGKKSGHTLMPQIFF